MNLSKTHVVLIVSALAIAALLIGGNIFKKSGAKNQGMIIHQTGECSANVVNTEGSVTITVDDKKADCKGQSEQTVISGDGNTIIHQSSSDSGSPNVANVKGSVTITINDAVKEQGFPDPGGTRQKK